MKDAIYKFFLMFILLVNACKEEVAVYDQKPESEVKEDILSISEKDKVINVTTNDNESDDFCDEGSLNTTCIINTHHKIRPNQKIIGSGNMIIKADGVLELSENTQTFSLNMEGDISIKKGGVIRGNLDHLSSNNLSVESGALIDASSLGYRGGKSGTNQSINGESAELGGGQGTKGKDKGGAGGGYGGQGGNGYPNFKVIGGTPYGSLKAPVDFGSGGGANAKAKNKGGDGGGKIIIKVTNNFFINGSIVANGEKGSKGTKDASGGGGSGGSIFIKTKTISGEGVIETIGGNGVDHTDTGDSGSGGGGRISIISSNAFSGVIRVLAGRSVFNATPGLPGSYYTEINNICDTGSLDTNCIIASRKVLSHNFQIVGKGNMMIKPGGSLVVPHPMDTIEINLGGNFTMEGHENLPSKIRANLNELKAQNIQLQKFSLIDATGMGHWGGEKPGGGANDSGNSDSVNAKGQAASGGEDHGGGGGAYGGTGGAGGGQFGGQEGDAFGSEKDPRNYGSGGGSAGGYLAAGGNGGGLVILHALESLLLNGVILANGERGVSGLKDRAGGGGSGGSVNITCNEFEGTGSIEANGGSGIGATDSGDGGGGGGGRVAFNCKGQSLKNVSVQGGRKVGQGNGGMEGSYYIFP